MFKGTYRHHIDRKGRVPVPAAFRRVLQERAATALVATPLDQCVAVYPVAEWHRLESQLRQLPAFSRDVKALTRLLASRAVDCGLDIQGRILVPATLRAAADLAGEAVIVGVVDRFELWAPERWDDFLRDSERLLDDVALAVQWPVPSPSVPEAPRSGTAPGPAAARRPQGKPSR